MKRDRLIGARAIGFSLFLSCMLCAAENRPNVELQQEAQTQLYIQTEPTGAQVNVDEKLQGESPHLFRLELPEGIDRVVVEIEKEGYQRKTQQITIQGGRVTRVKFELDPVPDEERLSATNVKLAAVQETNLPSPAGQTARLLDLDTGRWSVCQRFGEDDRQTHAWIRREKADLLGVLERDIAGVLFFDAAVIPVPAKAWDTISAAEIVSHRQLQQQEPGNITPLTPREDVSPNLQPEPTAIFRTREGAFGILQVLGTTERAGVVRVRYRLVEQTGPPSPDRADDAGRLDFRLAPVRSEAATDPAMISVPDEEVESSWRQWQDRGPRAVDDSTAAYRWFPVRGEIARELITRELNGQTYVLLSNQPGQIMLSHQDNEPQWGLRNVAGVVDGSGSPSISGEFDEAGSQRMGALTKRLVMNHLAVLLNDEVITTPRIVSPISQRFVIHGRFDRSEVDRIVSSLLRGMVWPSTSEESERPDPALKDTARHIVQLLEAAVQRYRLDMGTVPSTEEGLTALLTLPESESNTGRWQGPYVRGPIPTDPWGNAFRYRSPGQTSGDAFDLWSAGPDGEDGTRDDVGTWRESNE